jgi:hypothetical protein
MVDLDAHWRGFQQEKQSAIRYAMKAMGQAKSGEDHAACARFVVSMGLTTELGDMLMTNIIKRVVEIDDAGDPGSMLRNAGGFGQAAHLLTVPAISS